jgi:hypothetical protein
VGELPVTELVSLLHLSVLSPRTGNSIMLNTFNFLARPQQSPPSLQPKPVQTNTNFNMPPSTAWNPARARVQLK